MLCTGDDWLWCAVLLLWVASVWVLPECKGSNAGDGRAGGTGNSRKVGWRAGRPSIRILQYFYTRLRPPPNGSFLLHPRLA